MRPGFSYVGLIYLLMLYIPNIIWTKNKPEGYDDVVNNENKVLLVFERTGEVLMTVIALVFSDFNLREYNLWSTWLILSFICMVLYEISWIRYFKSAKKLEDFYKSILGIPVPLASLPVMAFFLLGIYGSNSLMILTAIILGIGHIGIHKAHAKEAGIIPKKKNIILKILKVLAIIVLVIVFGSITYVIAVRNIRFVKHYPNFIHGVEECTYVELNGQKQYVIMTGRDTSNPVIICLHGGPGSPDSFANYAYADNLTDKFTFVSWDQRGSGRTYYKNMASDPDNKTVTFEQALDDLDALVDYARERFGQDKVIILGHSYGSLLGSRYVTEHPDKVSAYIGVAQVVSLAKGDIYSYEDALKKAKEAGDDTSAMENAYKTYTEDDSLANYMALRLAVNVYHPTSVPDKALVYGFFSPYFGMRELDWFLLQSDPENYEGLIGSLMDVCMTYDVYNEKMDYEVPVYYISGTDDWVCPISMTEDYKDAITAPEKELYTLEGCGHNVQFSLPDEFADIIRNAFSDK